MLFANRLDLSVDESHRLNATCDIPVNEATFMFIDRTEVQKNENYCTGIKSSDVVR